MQPRSLLLGIAAVVIMAAAFSGSPRCFAGEQALDIPAWLRAHVGEGDDQIAPVVLQRARSLYLQKVKAGAVKNPCYFAMDATRPAGFGRRFYVICEGDRSFRAVSAGHGSGRNLKGIADFSNGIQCAKNFSNAMDSKLTTGGPYVTDETITSFKGYYRAAGKFVAFSRSFVQFDGEGDAANARPRAIGGHPAVLLRGVCLWKDPDSPNANKDGYVPLGNLVNYAAGRSNGCTSWSPSDAAQIIPMVKDKPTTLYIYPEFTRHQRRRASGEGRPLSVARRIILERLLLERNPLSQILAEGNPRADPRSIQEGSSGATTAADADLQGAVRFVFFFSLFLVRLDVAYPRSPILLYHAHHLVHRRGAS